MPWFRASVAEGPPRPARPLTAPQPRCGGGARPPRAACREHLGWSPTLYLWLRGMHLARGGLRVADPTATTVTEVATSYGFWGLGRFSVAYRSLFGEAP